MTATHDVVIVGGGPAGSTCARVLAAAGKQVAVIDRAEFPRVKLCAGWLSPGFWDAAGVAPSAYPHRLWEWHVAHVHFRGRAHAIPGHGWFIRRYELDDYLLRSSGAELVLGVQVKDVARDDDGLWHVGGLRAPILVGAGGTHCPVARRLAPPRPRRAAGVQELELQTDAAAIAQARLGDDGEPELLLFDDLSGYGWNVPKSDWLNVGCGTLDATRVRDAWEATHDHLRALGHLPVVAEPQLAHVKGHAYFLFDAAHLEAAARDGALLIGDALGLAHPLTAEGILPAATSGRVAAEAILDGAWQRYPERLRAHPLFVEYRRVHRVVELGRALKARLTRRTRRAIVAPALRPTRALTGYAVARGFAWMFSGRPLPAPRLVDRIARVVPAEGR